MIARFPEGKEAMLHRAAEPFFSDCSDPRVGTKGCDNCSRSASVNDCLFSREKESNVAKRSAAILCNSNDSSVGVKGCDGHSGGTCIHDRLHTLGEFGNDVV